MRFLALFSLLLLAGSGAMGAPKEESPAAKLWQELKAKRDALPGLHQEFDVERTFRTSRGTQSSKLQVIVDRTPQQWREKSISGSGSYLRIFTGADILAMEEGGEEFTRTKHKPKDDNPESTASPFHRADWSKAVERDRRPCPAGAPTGVCVLMEAPVKHWMRRSGSGLITSLSRGVQSVWLNLETGIAISHLTDELIDRPQDQYSSRVSFVTKSVSYSGVPDGSLFALAGQPKEVKEPSVWDAAQMKKRLVGKLAPELKVVDLQGRELSLAELRGKTVLLDFWTTWCPPCRADSPSLEKLSKKYGDKDLAIVGISVSEDREVVEKYLRQSPHSYPIVLTTENEMPRTYQVHAFPTYIVIDREGKVTAASQGDQGFSTLRGLLKKAGLEAE